MKEDYKQTNYTISMKVDYKQTTSKLTIQFQ